MADALTLYLVAVAGTVVFFFAAVVYVGLWGLSGTFGVPLF